MADHIRDALESARAFMVSLAKTREDQDAAKAAMRPPLERIERALGSFIAATPIHDAGAYAQCSYCRRYSARPTALTMRLYCDCGRVGGWSGSFVAPSEASQWSVEWRREGERPR